MEWILRRCGHVLSQFFIAMEGFDLVVAIEIITSYDLL